MATRGRDSQLVCEERPLRVLASGRVGWLKVEGFRGSGFRGSGTEILGLGPGRPELNTLHLKLAIERRRRALASM